MKLIIFLRNLLDRCIDFARKFPVLNRVSVRFYRFFFVGASGFVFSAIIFNFFYFIVGIQSRIEILEIGSILLAFSVANIIAESLGAVYGYTANKIWAFEDKGDNVTAQFSKYLLAAVVNNILNNIFFGFIFITLMGEPDSAILAAIAKFISTAFQAFSSFFFYKYFVFTSDKEVISEATLP